MARKDKGLGPQQGTNMQPGYATPGASAAAVERAGFGGSSAGNNGFSFDMTGLDQLKTKLGQLISSFTAIDTKVKSINAGLTAMGNKGGSMGGGAATSGGTITAAGFSNSPAASGAGAGAVVGAAAGAMAGKPNPNTPGPGGSGNTSAGFGGGGGGGNMLTGIAAAGMAAGAFGKVSGWMSGLQQGGVPVQLAAAQQAGITGGSTFGNVNAWNGVLNTGQADQAAAMNMAMQNNFLSTISPQSKNFNNMRGFLNATQKMGGVSASSAMGFLNDLTSNQATNFFTARTGGRAGPWNPRTGQMRGAQQSLMGALQGADPGLMGLRGSQLSNALRSISSRPGQWSVMAGNLEQGAGLSTSDVALLHQFAASGGNLGKATGGQVSKTVAEQLLAQTTQKTSLQNNLMQETSGLQVAFSKLSTTVSHLEQTLAGWTIGRMGGAVGRGLASNPIAGGLLGAVTSMVPGAGLLSNILGDPDTTSGMQPNLAHGITAMKRANPNLQINSGHRSSRQQAALYAAKGGRGVARPGQSPHQLGKAADIGPPSQFGWLAANARKFGLATDRHEPWHVQAIGDPVTGASVTGAQVVNAAQGVLGTPYSWGGGTATGPSKGIAQGANTVGFDCSHFIQYVFAQVGVSVPPPSQAQAGMGTPVASLAQAQAGDIILYSYGAQNDHVALYIGGGQQIAAPHTGATVSVQSVDTGSISTIRRIIGGGAGGKVVAAAKGAVGQKSTDSNHGGGSKNAVAAGGGLANNFIASLAGSWLHGGGGGLAAGGGSSGKGTTSGGGTSTGGSSTPGSSAPASGGGSESQWAGSVLSDGGFPTTQNNVNNMMRWMAAEEPPSNWSHNNNPLNINAGGSGSDTFPDLNTAASKTAAVIKQSNMRAIAQALAANANAGDFSAAVVGSPWAGSHYGGDPGHIASIPVPAGDPVGGFQPVMPMASPSGPGPVSALRGGGGGRGVSVSIGPIYVQGTQADANNIASMVASAIKGNKEIQAVARS